jgi:predicted RNA-binding Zn-ribbon protein involved in translation (DUF1610 family)
MNTARRNERTEAIVDAYRIDTGDDAGDALSDLLADLMHWAVEFDTEEHGETAGPQLYFDKELLRARYHYEAEREEGEPRADPLQGLKRYCDDCGWTGDTLNEVSRVHERVDPGEKMPEGECPECGALQHKSVQIFPGLTVTEV